MPVPDGSDVTITRDSILAFVGTFSLLADPNWWAFPLSMPARAYQFLMVVKKD